MPLAVEASVFLFFAITCAVIAYRILRAISLLREFGTPVIISLLHIVTLFLYVVPILAVPASARFPVSFFYPEPLVVLFFVPHLLLSRVSLRHLQSSGTSRVQAIERSISDSVWLGYAGIAYIGVIWLISYAASSVSSHIPR
jgi:hypothetical protein